MSLALVPNQQQQLAIANNDLRQRQFDDFDIASNPQLLEMFIEVACHLNTIHVCHRGVHRFQVLTTPFIRDSFQAALACITSPYRSETANKSFNLDQWYFDMLPDEVKARDDPTMADIQSASQTDHIADWFGGLKKLQQQWPGIIFAIHSAIQSQIKIVEKSKSAFQYAFNYVNTQEAPSQPRMGAPILKATRAPGGGGGRLIG